MRHLTEAHRDVCMLCGRTRQQIVEQNIAECDGLAASPQLRRVLAGQDEDVLRKLYKLQPDGPKDAARIKATIAELEKRLLEARP